MIASCLRVAIFSVPLFILMDKGTFLSFLIVQVAFGLFYSLMAGPAPAALAEMFPAQIRVAAVTTGVIVALIIFGGPTPAIQTWLVGVTGSHIAAAFWLVGAAVVGLAVVLFGMRENAGRPLE
jgi:MHS family proline/betaine transporter-like MFS transporter